MKVVGEEAARTYQENTSLLLVQVGAIYAFVDGTLETTLSNVKKLEF